MRRRRLTLEGYKGEGCCIFVFEGRKYYIEKSEANTEGENPNHYLL